MKTVITVAAVTALISVWMNWRRGTLQPWLGSALASRRGSRIDGTGDTNSNSPGDGLQKADWATDQHQPSNTMSPAMNAHDGIAAGATNNQQR